MSEKPFEAFDLLLGFVAGGFDGAPVFGEPFDFRSGALLTNHASNGGPEVFDGDAAGVDGFYEGCGAFFGGSEGVKDGCLAVALGRRVAVGEARDPCGRREACEGANRMIAEDVVGDGELEDGL